MFAMLVRECMRMNSPYAGICSFPLQKIVDLRTYYSVATVAHCYFFCCCPKYLILLFCSQGTNQQDVQELNRILFSALEHSLVDTAGSAFIQRLYHGTLVNSIVCKECGNVSQRQVGECFQGFSALLYLPWLSWQVEILFSLSAAQWNLMPS